jgi:DNA-binding transcriptional regulator YdaS (Cro superfamily)
MATAKMRTLAKAAETLGSEKALADALGVSISLVASWLTGRRDAPDAAYFAALEIVARGPFNPKRRTA